jgi:multidrug transporter EmrE-like cation transporter
VRNQLDLFVYILVNGVLGLAYLAVFHVNWAVVFTGQVVAPGRLVAVIGLAGALNIGGYFCMLQAMRLGHNGITWTIGESAMVVPFAASLAIWHNPVALSGGIGVALVLATLVILGVKQEAPGADAQGAGRRRGWFPLALGAFLLLGVSEVFCTIPSRWAGWVDTANLRVPLMSLAPIVLAAIVVRVRRSRFQRKNILVSCIGAAVGTASTVLMFRGLDMPERCGYISIVYPLAVGVCITSFALYSWLGIKERFRARELAGIALGVVGIALLAWAY